MEFFTESAPRLIESLSRNVSFVCPFLSVSVGFCLFLPVLFLSVCFGLFLSVSIHFYLCLFVSVRFCTFLTVFFLSSVFLELCWSWCYCLHTTRDSVSPICGIFRMFFNFLTQLSTLLNIIKLSKCIALFTPPDKN